MDEMSEFEDMCMRLEALIEEEKQAQEHLKQLVLCSQENVDMEWKFKVSFILSFSHSIILSFFSSFFSF
jgi:hypothetical protein